MALIQGGKLKLPEQKKGHDKVSPGGKVATDSAKPRKRCRTAARLAAPSMPVRGGGGRDRRPAQAVA